MLASEIERLGVMVKNKNEEIMKLKSSIQGYEQQITELSPVQHENERLLDFVKQLQDQIDELKQQADSLQKQLDE
jgi:prefoldin subunit 5